MFFSTSQPPHAAFKLVADGQILSTTQPPSSTQSAMVAMARGEGTAALARLGIAKLRADGRLPAPLTTSETGASLGDSGEVLGLLAGNELTCALSISSSGKWSPAHGFPDSKAAMSFEDDTGADIRLEHTLPGRSRALYFDSVREVLDTMTEFSAFADEVRFQAPAPALMLALSIGMDRDEASYPLPFTALVVDVVVQAVTAPTHRLKNQLLVPRPYADWAGLPHQIEPKLDKPGYSGFPSGHATVSAAIAAVLTGLGHTLPAPLVGQIARNRERAGLHTGVDSIEGLALGTALGGWLVAAAAHEQAFPTWRKIFLAAQKTA